MPGFYFVAWPLLRRFFHRPSLYNQCDSWRWGDDLPKVYLDSVFLLNMGMDYLLCLLTARLAGIPLRRRRYLLAAFWGGIYAVSVFLPEAAFLSTAPAKLLAGLLMVLIAYGGELRLFRLMLLCCLVSCLMAGALLGASLLINAYPPLFAGVFLLNPRITVLVIVCLMICLVLKLIFQSSIQNGIQGKLFPARICIQGQSCPLTVLWDTGNQLCDPVHGQSVLVISAKVFRELLPANLQHFLKQQPLCFPPEFLEAIHTYAPELKPCFLPYRTVGKPSGTLLAVRSDWVEIGGTRYRNTLVALAPSSLGESFDALWGGELKMGRTHETFG